MVAPGRDRLRAAFGLPRDGPAPTPRLPAARDGPGAQPGSELGSEPGDDRRGDVRELLRRRAALAARPVVELPAGDECRNSRGVFWRRLLHYPLDHLHGRVRLGDALTGNRAGLTALARTPAVAALDRRQCLLLDTETTGLSGGAGTVVFLFGLGTYADDAFVLEQLFLRDFGEEAAILQHVTEQLLAHPTLVTYVGKSFDRHRVAARLSVNRMVAPILTDQHLDLYHVARRAYARTLPDCRLRTVEQLRLGLQRSDDLPGSEAPAAFLDWLRDRTGPIDRVLEHNRLDVLSVAALLAVLGAP